MTRTLSTPDKIILASIGVAVAAAVSMLLVRPVHAEPVAGIQYSSIATVATSNASQASAHTKPARLRMLEIHIANNGLVLVRGAHIDSIRGNEIIIDVTWGTMQLAWRAEVDSNTKYFNDSGEKISLDDIHSSDILTVTGMLTSTGAQPTIAAQYVRRQ